MGFIASDKGLKIVEKARLRKGWARQATIWYNQANVSLGTLKRFTRGKEAISEENFKAICETLGLNWEEIVDWDKIHKNPVDDNYPVTQIFLEEDCNEMPDVDILYGRHKELENLKQSILDDRSRAVVLCGQAGIGKTAFAAKLVEEVKPDFKYFCWRTLNYSPSPTLSKLLSGLIQFLSSEENTELPSNIDDLIDKLLRFFLKHRVLLVLDNWEKILQTQNVECYQTADYEKYNELLKIIVERKHQSCVIIVTQEEPKKLSLLKANSHVNLMRLQGLSFEASLKILTAKKLTFTEEQAKKLINDYNGNPLALNHICEHIQKVFAGNVLHFETKYTILFPLEFKIAIEKNCKYLSKLEAEALRIIAFECKPIEYEKLKLQIWNNYEEVSNSDLQNALSSLFEHCLIERNSQGREIFYNLQAITRKCIRKLYENNIESFNF